MEVEDEREELLRRGYYRNREAADLNLGLVSQVENNDIVSLLKLPANEFAKLEGIVKVDEVISSSTHGQTCSERIFFDNDIGGEYKQLFSDIEYNDLQGILFEKDFGENGLFSKPMELDSERIQSNDFNYQSKEENLIDASNSKLGVHPIEKSSNGYSMKKSTPEITAAIDESSLMKETGYEKTEYDVERVLEKQETHDLYCPNCRSCITRRVILRKRKRTVHISEELEAEVIPYLDVDATEDQSDKALDHKRLATIENVTVHVNGSSSAANDSYQVDEPEMFRCLSCFSFFIPTGNGFRLFNLSQEKTEKENREKIDTISAPKKNLWHFLFHSDKVQNSETDKKNFQKGDIGISTEFSSPSDPTSSMPEKRETNKTGLHNGISNVPYPAKAPVMIGKVISNARKKPDGTMDNDRAKEETNTSEMHYGTNIVPYPAKAPRILDKVIYNAGEKLDGAMDNGKAKEETDKTELPDGISVMPYPAKSPENFGKILLNAGDKPDNAMDKGIVKEETNKTDLHGAMNNGRGLLAIDHSLAQSGSNIVKHVENVVPKYQKHGLKVLVDGNFNSINPLAVEETEIGSISNFTEQQGLDGKPNHELRYVVMGKNIFGDIPKKLVVKAHQNDGSTIGEGNSLSKNSTNYQDLRDVAVEENIVGDLHPMKQVVEAKHNDGSTIGNENSPNKYSTTSKPDIEPRGAIIEENIPGDIPPKEQIVESRKKDGSSVEDENSPNRNSTNFLHSRVSGYPVVGTKVDIHIEKPLNDDEDLSISIHNSSLLPDKKITGTSNLKVVLENKEAGGHDTVILIEDQSEHAGLPSSQDVAEVRAVQQTRHAEATNISGLDIVKSVVFGGLIESITSLGIVSSAVGADVSTLNTFALSIANLVVGVFLIIHNIWDLREEHDAHNTSTESTDRYIELLGSRQNFWAQTTVGVLSFLFFGSIPPVIYAFSFHNKDFKLVAVTIASMLCIILLASGKVYVQRQPAKDYVKTIVYYIIMGSMASGISYLAGDLINKLLKKLALFESGEAALNMSVVQLLTTETMGSSSY